MLRKSYIGISVCAMVCASYALGQELERTDSPFQRYQTQISGAQTPNLVAKHVYVRHLMFSLTSIDVPPEDVPILTALQAQLLQAAEDAGQRSRSSLRELCTQLQEVDQAMGASAFVTLLQTIENEGNAAIVELYDAAMARLTESGRRVVDNHLHSRVLPTLTVVDTDYSGLAGEFPEQSLRAMQLGCGTYAVTAGEVQVQQGRPDGEWPAEDVWPDAESDLLLIP